MILEGPFQPKLSYDSVSQLPARIRKALTLRFWRRGNGPCAEFSALLAFQPFAFWAGGGSQAVEATKSSSKRADWDPALCDSGSWGLGSIPEHAAGVGGSVTFSRVFAAKTNAPFSIANTYRRFCCSALEGVRHDGVCHAVVCNHYCSLCCVQTPLICHVTLVLLGLCRETALAQYHFIPRKLASCFLFEGCL